jgi:hypothetical protein
MGFAFDSIAHWANELYEAAGAFRERFGVRPNTMSARLQVYRALDDIVRGDLENVVDDCGRHPNPGEEFELSGFTADDWEILFTLNDMTPYPGFLLIFDEDPDFDGEEETVAAGHIKALRYQVV